MPEGFSRGTHTESIESPKTPLVSECFVAVLAVIKHATDFHKEVPTFWCVGADGVTHQLRVAPIGEPVLQIQKGTDWLLLDTRTKHKDFRLTAASTHELEELRSQMVDDRRERLPLRPLVEDSGYGAQEQTERAHKEGFNVVEFEPHHKAQELVDKLVAHDPQFQKNGVLDMGKVREYWDQYCSNLPDVPKQSAWWFQALFDKELDAHQTDGLDIPITVPYIPNFASRGSLFVLDVPIIPGQNFSKELLFPAIGVLAELFTSRGRILVNRDKINRGLYDGEPNLRVQSQKAKEIINRILGPGGDQAYELRLMHYAEFVRVFEHNKSYVRKSNVYFEGYYKDHKGSRSGLWGGHVDNGGAARVSYGDRTNNYSSSAAILVIARK